MRRSKRYDIRALGIYIDSDDPEEIEYNFKSNEPHTKYMGNTPLDFIRRYSSLGNQVRVLMKDKSHFEFFERIVNTKRGPYHTRDMLFGEISPEDMTGEISLIALPIEWEVVGQRVKDEEFGTLAREFGLSGTGGGFEGQYNRGVAYRYVSIVLKFYEYWENSLMQSLRARAGELMSEHFQDSWLEQRISVEKALKELKRIENKENF